GGREDTTVVFERGTDFDLGFIHDILSHDKPLESYFAFPLAHPLTPEQSEAIRLLKDRWGKLNFHNFTQEVFDSLNREDPVFDTALASLRAACEEQFAAEIKAVQEPNSRTLPPNTDNRSRTFRFFRRNEYYGKVLELVAQQGVDIRSERQGSL